jgi:hypothetical protein
MLSLVCTAAQAVVGKWADALTATVKGRSRFEATSELQLFAALIERPHPHVFAPQHDHKHKTSSLAQPRIAGMSEGCSHSIARRMRLMS